MWLLHGVYQIPVPQKSEIIYTMFWTLWSNYIYIYQMLLSKATYSAFRLYIYYQYMGFLGIEPTTFVLLTQCSTTEPQEH